MEGVKLQNTVQVKTGTKSTTAAKPAAQDDGFVKLLQEKRDMAEPKKAEADKAPDKTGEGKKTEDSAPDKTAEKAEKTEESQEEKTPDGEGMEDEALLQAMLQQTAAQMAGILSEVQEPAEETAEGISDENLNPIEGLITEGQTQAVEAVQHQTETAVQSVPQETEGKEPDTSPKEESQNQGDMGILKNVSKESGEREAEPAVQTAKSSQPSVREERKAGPAEETVSQQPLYHEGNVKEEPGQVSLEGKTQEVPLKTTQADLPQDLGKTLAARLPKSGGELTIELEPAALGKLTIRLVYEGERAAVSILSSNPRTLELLSQRAAEIASILEEKTGEETIVYTQPAEQQEEQDPNRNPGGHGGQPGREEQHENRRDDRHQTESFAQQLRLGLV